MGGSPRTKENKLNQYTGSKSQTHKHTNTTNKQEDNYWTPQSEDRMKHCEENSRQI